MRNLDVDGLIRGMSNDHQSAGLEEKCLQIIILLNAGNANDNVRNIDQIHISFIWEVEEIDHLAERVIIPITMSAIVEIELCISHGKLLVGL